MVPDSERAGVETGTLSLSVNAKQAVKQIRGKLKATLELRMSGPGGEATDRAKLTLKGGGGKGKPRTPARSKRGRPGGRRQTPRGTGFCAPGGQSVVDSDHKIG